MSIVIPPGKGVYFIGNQPCPVRLGGALFARKESGCVKVENNTRQLVTVGFYDVTSNGSTYMYIPTSKREDVDPSLTKFFERPEFKGALKGDREIIATFPNGIFMRRTISGGFSGLREAPNTFSINLNKIDATKQNFEDRRERLTHAQA